MLGNKRIVCVIPARLESSRFPRKVLAKLNGKPLLQWVYEKASKIPFFDEVVIAVDSMELKEVSQSFGAKAILTSRDCQSGTDRLVELKMRKELEADIWVGWQADEPFVTQEVIETLLQSVDSDEEIWTLKKKIHDPDVFLSPHVVKVVTEEKGRALYFSRTPIPYEGLIFAYKHIGLYAFSAKALEKISTLSVGSLEKQESLEQLRFLENGMAIRVHETTKEVFGIDTPEELERAQKMSLTPV